MRLGYIDYLNTYPLYWRMFADSTMPAGVDLIADKPGALNRMMRAGELDISPVSVACLPDIQSDVHLLSEFCLGAHGDVRSVLLLSHYPIDKLDGRRIGLTTASETSVVLLRYLLEQCHGLSPSYSPYENATNGTASSTDAIRLIGHDSLVAHANGYNYVYDLARLWYERTGLPMVFAVFVVRRDALAQHSETIGNLRRLFGESLNAARADKPGFITRAEEAYPGVQADLVAYFEAMKYDFTDHFKASLSTYLEAAQTSRLLPPIKELSFV